ncbi:MAG TPA: glycoside hydrolase family 25 protein [Candidatus Limnocylindrales bacterium]|nr:glycoside hydrolase family 25 protein [Candidatus Limnocylindrales bacterium]
MIAAGLLATVIAAPATLAGSAAAPSATRPAADATAGILEGIDVSHWQNTINWTRVAAAGKKFAIIKASESTTYVDPLFATNRANAQAAGLWTGAYHFARPDATANDALLEAGHFASTVRLGTRDLIPALDLEAAGGLSVPALQNWVTTWLNEVTRRTGSRPMIYTSPAFWTKYMGDTSALADAGYKTLWVAHWGVSSPTVPARNWGGKGWTFWQYSNCGTVSGISGCVDLDRYRGSDLAAQAFSVFRLTATTSTSIKQGRTGTASVGIVRTNFGSPVALNVAGLPAGAAATFGESPTTSASVSMTVKNSTSTPTGTYPLTITADGGGLQRTTRVTLVVADGIAPKLTAPVTSVMAGRSLGGSSVALRVGWTFSDPSGILNGHLQRSVNNGAWTNVGLATVRSLAASQTLAFNSSARQRSVGTDRAGNVSAWFTGPRVTAGVSQQTSTAIRYAGSWRSQTWASASGGSFRSATTASASATYTFTGSSVGWITSTGPTRGTARVYVDGVYAGPISLYSSTTRPRWIAFARSWATNGTHSIRVVVVGTPGHPRVDVDGFVRLVNS